MSNNRPNENQVDKKKPARNKESSDSDSYHTALESPDDLASTSRPPPTRRDDQTSPTSRPSPTRPDDQIPPAHRPPSTRRDDEIASTSQPPSARKGYPSSTLPSVRSAIPPQSSFRDANMLSIQMPPGQVISPNENDQSRPMYPSLYSYNPSVFGEMGPKRVGDPERKKIDWPASGCVHIPLHPPSAPQARKPPTESILSIAATTSNEQIRKVQKFDVPEERERSEKK